MTAILPEHVPVITIDGPTASGKGTVAHRVAKALGWSVLDSGALYRLTALAALRRGVPADDEPAVARVAQALDVRFDGPHVYLDGAEASHDIRREEAGNFASRVAAFPGVRQALLELFLIQKAAYEVQYEAANRPAWLSIPIRGLLSIVGRKGGADG